MSEKFLRGHSVPQGFKRWTCDFCTAGCTFEAMQWCAKRLDEDAECGFDNDQPLAMDEHGRPSNKGIFDFVHTEAFMTGKKFRNEKED